MGWLQGNLRRLSGWAQRARQWTRLNGRILIVEGIAFGVAASSVRLGFPHAPDFLGSVVTFETTSVALIVPLSLNWAFTVYSTYQSRAVREQLFRDPVLSRLVVVTILNVLVVILAHAVFSATPEAAALWKSLSVFGFINCFIVAWLLLAYLRQLREQIITEPDWILDRMTTDALTELEDIE